MPIRISKVGSAAILAPTGPTGALGPQVKIATVTMTDSSWIATGDSSLSPSGGYVVLAGQGFTGATALSLGENASYVTATSMTVISDSEIRAQFPAVGASNVYHLYLTNANGSVTLKPNGINTDSVTWSSPAADSTTMATANTAFDLALSASSASGTAVTYSLVSGTLPAGLAVSGSSISGTATGDTAASPVTIRATAATGAYADRTFNVGSTTYIPDVGLFGGGYTTNAAPGVLTDTVLKILVSTTGNGTNFGTLNLARASVTSGSSATRAVWAGGSTDNGAADYSNVIDYMTIASGGTGQSFGSLTTGRYALGAASSPTRIVFAGGWSGSGVQSAVMDYITTATLGNASNFGSLINALGNNPVGFSSPTRGIIAGGRAATSVTTISYITFASPGNATFFGDLTGTRWSAAGVSNSVRGVIGGNAIIGTAVMEYVTIASLGNSTTFGNLAGNYTSQGGTSNTTRGVFAGGSPYGDSAPKLSVMEYITIGTTGNSTSFGTLSVPTSRWAGCGDAIGGLQ